MTANYPSAETYAATVHQIFELRRALAYEGEVLNAHLMPSFPRKPGVIGRQLVIDAARAATGEVGWVFSRASDSEMQGPAAKYDTGFSAALREVDDLRQVLGSFASTLDSFLAYKTFPASRRRYATEQVARLRQAAAGQLDQAYQWTHTTDLNRALRNAYVDQNRLFRTGSQMTVGQWEDERRSWLGGEPMNDVEYRAARATLEDAHRVIQETGEAVLAAAVIRGEAYVVRAHRHFETVEVPFITLVEAQAFADSDECSPIEIVSPGRR